MRRKIWVVEIRHAGKGSWHTTVGARLNRDDARQEMMMWRARNGDDRFRIRLYFASRKP